MWLAVALLMVGSLFGTARSVGADPSRPTAPAVQEDPTYAGA